VERNLAEPVNLTQVHNFIRDRPAVERRAALPILVGKFQQEQFQLGAFGAQWCRIDGHVVSTMLLMNCEAPMLVAPRRLTYKTRLID
jgi:hypothetical protein